MHEWTYVSAIWQRVPSILRTENVTGALNPWWGEDVDGALILAAKHGGTITTIRLPESSLRDETNTVVLDAAVKIALKSITLSRAVEGMLERDAGTTLIILRHYAGHVI